MRRRRPAIAADPLLIGAVAIFMTTVLVYFAYNADSGLPVVPTYELRAVLPDAENVARNAEVSMAGVRVGRVRAREVRMLGDGRTEAVLTLAVDTALKPLPIDTTMRMRATSSLGGNYVELLPGRSEQPLRGSPPTIGSGAKAALPTLSDAMQAYDAPTRRAVEENLTGYGNAFVGRGSDLNGFIHEAPRTLDHLDGAARVLAAPTSRLGPFIDGLSRFNGALAPVAEQQAGLFVGLDRTLDAMATVRDDVAQSATDAPGALQAGIDGFPRQRELLRATSSFFAALAPGVHAASGASRDIEGAAVDTPPALNALERLAPDLASNANALQQLSEDPATVPALGTLLSTLETLRPTLSDLTPAQVVCNSLGALVRNAASAVSDGYNVGNWLTTSTVLHLPGPNAESAPSTGPADAPPGADGQDVNRLHATTTPYTGKGPQGAECEAGNEVYSPGQVIGHAPGKQRGATVSTAPEAKKK